MQEQVNSKTIELSSIAAEAGVVDSKIGLWEEKSGNVCMECEQEIPHSHTNDKIEVLRQQLNDYNSNIKFINAEISELNKTILNAQELLENKKPSTTVAEAKSLNDQYERCNKEIDRLKN